MRAAICLFLTLLVALPVHAQSKSDVEKARAHFVTGEAAFKRGDFDVAIREYEAAYALVPRAELLFNIGSAYRRRGEAGSLSDKKAALEHYRRYLEAAPDGKGAPDARRRIEALNAAIAEAEKPPPEPPSTPPETAPAAVAPAPAAPVDAPPPGRTRRPWRIAGIATASVGVALLGAGVFFGLRASAAKDDLGELGPGDTWDHDRYDDGRAAERNMFIALGVGAAAAVAGGAVMYFVLGRERPVSTVSAVPLRGGGAVVWGTRF